VSTWVKLAPVLFVALVLHTSVLPEMRVAGVAAEILLLIAVVAGLEAGAERGAVIAFVAGLLGDLFVQTPFGLSALAYALVAYTVGSVQGTMLRATPWLPTGVSALASGVGVVVVAVMGAVVGQSHMVNERLWRVALLVAVLNGVLSLVVVPVMRWAVDDGGRSAGMALR
jgi:rod shape-determining protein MreD